MSAFATDLKAWARRMGWTRNQAAVELRVPRATYDGWCAGRPAAQEGMARRLMAQLERQKSPPA